MPLQQFDERIIMQAVEQFTHASTPGTYANLIDFSGVGDGRIDTVQVTNNDTIDHNVALSMSTSDAQILGEVVVPAGSGYGAIAAVDMLAALYPSAYHYIMMPAGFTLNLTVRETINTGKLVTISCMGGTF